MGVLKCNATGHGAIQLGKKLEQYGAKHLAVATLLEAVQLRKGGVSVPILVFGNSLPSEMATFFKYDIVPAVSTFQAVEALAKAVEEVKAERTRQQKSTPVGKVHIALDTGMHRNGCQPEFLSSMVEKCRELHIEVAGIYSHFAHYEDPDFTKAQIELFKKTVTKYRNEGILCHLAHAGGILHNIGADYDYVRPGITMYGLPPSKEDVDLTEDLGFKPILSIHSNCTLVKKCTKGSKIGYSCTYTCSDDEYIATLPIGFGDGYRKGLANTGTVLHAKSGSLCPVVGGVSMDAITVRVPKDTVDIGDEFVVMTADFHPQTSVTAVAHTLGTNPQEICCGLSLRLPRYYMQGGEVVHVTTPPGIHLEDISLLLHDHH